MPKVALTFEQKIQSNLEKLTRDTKHQLDDMGISQKELAERIGITPGAVSKQFSNKHITTVVLVAAQMMIEERRKGQC